MLAPVTRVLLCLALCLVLLSSWGCPSDGCVEYQDVALVDLPFVADSIDSVVMIANDSITGCGDRKYWGVIGSKTHSVKFPINVRIQLFLHGDLWKEFFLKMDKNTEVKIYDKFGCLKSFGPYNFPSSVESAKKNNRFIDSSLTDDYCWLLEKINSGDLIRCTELSVDGEQELCGKL